MRATISRSPATPIFPFDLAVVIDNAGAPPFNGRFIAGRVSFGRPLPSKDGEISCDHERSRAHFPTIKGRPQSPRDINSRPAPNGDRCPYESREHAMSVSKLSATAPSPNEFRAFAEEAADWARTARLDKERGIFLQMARTWLEAAETLERRRVCL